MFLPCTNLVKEEPGVLDNICLGGSQTPSSDLGERDFLIPSASDLFLTNHVDEGGNL